GELRLALVGLFGRVPADGRRVEEDVGAGECREARALRIPLIPADERGNATDGGVERGEPGVARREVVLLVVERVVGDVHLPVETAERPVGVEDHRGVVVDAGGAALEDGADDDDRELARELPECVGRRTGYRLGEVERGRVFGLAEVAGPEELRQTDEPRAAGRRLTDAGRRCAEVRLRIRRAAHLDQAQAEAGGRAHSRAGCRASARESTATRVVTIRATIARCRAPS